MERMNAYTKLTESEFFSIGSTIFRKVVKLPAPKLVDACSKEPSICFSPATACRYPTGSWRRAIPRIIIASVPVISSGPSLKARIMARPINVPGRETGSMARKSITVLPGNFLRSTRNARAMPKTVLIAAVDMDATQEFTMTLELMTPSLKYSRVKV